MTDQLDLLLESVREDEPNDEAFVQRVMADVRADETRRAGRRRLRRPMVFGISAAIVVTGGAVAAVVGTNPSSDEAQATRRPAIVVTSEEPADEPVAPKATQARPAKEDPAPESTTTPVGAGYATDHSSFIVDDQTGLMLRTDTYTTEFTASKPQRVTLTLENTGRYPIAMSTSQGCALQVMAYGADGPAPDTSLLTDPDGKFEWVCAGSDADPRSTTGDESWVLAPGERRTADASLVLPETGAWKVNGMCRCDYTQVKPTPFETSDPLNDLTNRALPSPLLPEQPDGQNLVTPAIGVRAR